MLWLADENVERASIVALRDADYDVRSIRETDPGILDPEVMSIALDRHCVIITEDQGFGGLVFRDSQPTLGVVLLRLYGGTAEARAERLLEMMPLIERRMPGWFVVVEDTTMRWREV